MSPARREIYKLIDELVSGPPEGGSGPPKGGLYRDETDSPPVVSGFSRTRPQKAVLIVSSYFPELLALCDRIAVMSRGHLGEPRAAAEWTEHALVLEASGAGVPPADLSARSEAREAGPHARQPRAGPEGGS